MDWVVWLVIVLLLCLFLVLLYAAMVAADREEPEVRKHERKR